MRAFAFDPVNQSTVRRLFTDGLVRRGQKMANTTLFRSIQRNHSAAEEVKGNSTRVQPDSGAAAKHTVQYMR